MVRQLETKRLNLKILTEEDEEEFKSMLNEGILFRFVLLKQKASRYKNSSEFFQSILKSYSSLESIRIFRIFHKLNQNCIGLCAIISDHKATAQCFYFLSPPYRKNGFALEALKKILEYSFESLKLVKIKAMISRENTNGWKVAERSGMMYMGEYNHKMLYEVEKRDFLNQTKY